ncbi:MAG: DUF2934 domain-containing protein [Candidatus Omnitrophica bacterium]|nr:DUF2934 domain-containing protein [Candidatus Omnitrophota bacterium]
MSDKMKGKKEPVKVKKTQTKKASSPKSKAKSEQKKPVSKGSQYEKKNVFSMLKNKMNPADSKTDARTNNQIELSEEGLRSWLCDRAYYIWQERGCPTGCDLEIWHQAEAEMLASKILKRK